MSRPIDGDIRMVGGRGGGRPCRLEQGTTTVRRRRPPKPCGAVARCCLSLISFSLVKPGGAFQSISPLLVPQQQHMLRPIPPLSEPAGGTRLFSIASDGLTSLGFDDASWRFHPGSGSFGMGSGKPWRLGTTTTTSTVAGGRGLVQVDSIVPAIKEAWKSSREESQVMQALILRAQSDPLEMLRILLSNSYACNYVNVCTVMHRCARLASMPQSSSKEVVMETVRSQLLPIVTAVLPECRGRHLCNVAWALAKLRLAGEEEYGAIMFDAIITRLEDPEMLESCNAGELAMAVWSTVSAGSANKYAGFLEMAAEPITAKAHLLKPKEIGLITWAYATALTHDWRKAAPRHHDEDYDEDDEEVEEGGEEMKWLVRPVQALLDRTMRCEDQLKPKDIAMLAWAFGRLAPLDWNVLGPQVDMLCAVLASSALKCIRQFQARDLAELAVGVVHMQYDNANLMQLIACEATRQLRHFSHRELSNLIWAYGKVFRRPRKFVLAAVEEARLRLPYFSQQELANLAWALTVLEVYDVSLLSEVFALVQRRGDQLDESDLNQLYQVYSLLKLQAPDAVEQSVGPRLLREMVGAWSRSKQREKRRTDRQAAVSKVLQSLHIEHVLEAEHDIDILVEEAAIAMEVDGPAHFLRNTGHPMGHTVMKRRILERLGYSVVSIPHFEWDRIPHWSSMELKRYIQRKCTLSDILQFSRNDFSSLRSFPRHGKKNRFD